MNNNYKKTRNNTNKKKQESHRCNGRGAPLLCYTLYSLILARPLWTATNANGNIDNLIKVSAPLKYNK